MRENTEVNYLKGFILYTLNMIFAGFLITQVLTATREFVGVSTEVDSGTIAVSFVTTAVALHLLASFFLFRWIIRTQIVPQLTASSGGERR